MAEKEEKQVKKEKKPEFKETVRESKERKIDESVTKLIRILATDIPGNKKIYPGLTRIKGVSWSYSNAICNLLNLDKAKKVEDLTEAEIQKITNLLKKAEGVPQFLMNARKDFSSGENSHIIGSDLDLKRDFDIKRLKKIRSYRGWRHATGQPVRGQRTRNHFRKNKAVGVGKKAKPAA